MNGWNSERVIAIVRLVAQVVAMVAGGFGLVVDTDGLATIVLCIVAAVMGVYNWWINSNITIAAQEAQKYLDAIKSGGSDQLV